MSSRRKANPARVFESDQGELENETELGSNSEVNNFKLQFGKKKRNLQKGYIKSQEIFLSER